MLTIFHGDAIQLDSPACLDSALEVLAVHDRLATNRTAAVITKTLSRGTETGGGT